MAYGYNRQVPERKRKPPSHRAHKHYCVLKPAVGQGLTELAVESEEACEAALRTALRNCSAEEARIGSGAPGAPLRLHTLCTIRSPAPSSHRQY
eukprot:1962185-Rhodomonas_salina.1